MFEFARKGNRVQIISLMKTTLSFLLLLIFNLSLSQAADKPLTAFEVLKHAEKQLGEKYSKKLVSMESQNAKLRPRYWWIRFYDDTVWLKVRAVQMIGPEMIRNIIPGNPFDGGNAEHLIDPDQLKYDSERCIAFIEKAAAQNQIPLHALNAKLEKPHPGESNPIWTFDWLDETDVSLGKISISATTGKVTEIIGLKIKDPRFQGVSKKTLSQGVGDTFMGIGADLEEFFTGKRSVDKPEESKPKK
jgi:hypothetical protein